MHLQIAKGLNAKETEHRKPLPISYRGCRYSPTVDSSHSAHCLRNYLRRISNNFSIVENDAIEADLKKNRLLYYPTVDIWVEIQNGLCLIINFQC